MPDLLVALNKLNPIQLFQKAAQEIPAYRDFLRRKGCDPKKIRTLADFARVPVMDKKSYLTKYDLPSFFPGKIIPAMAYASSGSAGQANFWFRGDEQEKYGTQEHERIFRDVFGIRKQDTTLVIVAFGMGIWVAGNYTLASCRGLARKGYNVTCITTGPEQADFLNVLRDLAPRFHNVVVSGFPTFVMDTMLSANRRKITMPRRMFMFTAGDKANEEWRDTMCQLMGARDPHRSIINIYGSADTGFIGHETPLTVFVRRAALKNKKLHAVLFGEQRDLPAFVQYNPEHVYIEESKGELLLTTRTASPLIRYNIHDIGKVISPEELKRLLADCQVKIPASLQSTRWRMPFLVLKGRTDVAVTFYAFNIYPEHIQAGLTQAKVAPLVSGNYVAYNKTVQKGKKEELHFNVELASGVKSSQKSLKTITAALAGALLERSSEFRKMHSLIGTKIFPQIHLVSFGHPALHQKTSRGILGLRGKKPRIIL